MLPKQGLRRQAEMQIADGNDLQPVVIQRHAHRAAADGVIPMHEGIGQGLAQRLHRQQRRIYPRHLSRDDASGDGQGFVQEAFGPAHQGEGVAVELPVIEKLIPVHALEARHLEQQLRKIRQLILVLAEQHHRRPRQAVTFNQQAKPAQNFQRLAGAGVVEAPPANGLLQSQHHFPRIQPGHVPAIGGLVLPALHRVHFFHQQPLVSLARHDSGGVQHPLIGHPAKRHRRPRGPLHAHRQHLASIRNGYPLHPGKQRRLEVLEFLRQFLLRAVGDDLADHLARRRHAEQQAPALTVGEGAQRAAGAILLGGGFLEFQGEGFRLGGEGAQVVERGHAMVSGMRSLPDIRRGRRVSRRVASVFASLSFAAILA